MPRIKRAVASGHPHHVTQRGNYRREVFESPEDYSAYLSWLGEYAEKYGLKIWAYCLMGNHVHFVVVPLNEDSMAMTFRYLHMRYSRRVNSRNNLVGHFWQGRYYSSVLDERYLYSAVRYVENNPVRARICKRAEDYMWSSAASHVNGHSVKLLSSDLPLLDSVGDWREYLAGKDCLEVMKALRMNTRTGRPCGDEGFVSKLEARLSRKLMPRGKGRPRKGTR